MFNINVFFLSNKGESHHKFPNHCQMCNLVPNFFFPFVIDAIKSDGIFLIYFFYDKVANLYELNLFLRPENQFVYLVPTKDYQLQHNIPTNFLARKNCDLS